MRRVLVLLLMAFGMAKLWSCQNVPEARVTELCRHLPDVDSLKHSEGWLTQEYYSALEAMIAIPDSTELLHEWEFWFVAADGSPIARASCTLLSARRMGAGSAEAVILVQPEDSDYEAEEHWLRFEKVKGNWLISDFDDTKQQATNRVAHES